MPTERISELRARIDRISAGPGDTKVTVHFAGEKEESFLVPSEWTISASVGLPGPDDLVVFFDRTDPNKPETVLVPTMQTAFIRFEFSS